MLKVLRWHKGKKEGISFSKYNPNTGSGWVYGTNISIKELEQIHEKLNIPLYELKHVLDKRERPRFFISKKFVSTLMVEDNDSIDKVFDEIDLNALSNLSK